MERNILFIGVLERDEDRDVLNVIKQFLKLPEFKIIYEYINGTIIGFCKTDQILILVDFLEEDLVEEDMTRMDFDVFIHNLSENKENSLVNEMLARSKICVLNSDDESLVSLAHGLSNTLTITYGFNGRATLTISSYDVDPIIKINLCLQRDITSLNGYKTEPFEFCISIDSTDEKMIYSLLAGAALNIIMGNTILNNNQEDYILLTV